MERTARSRGIPTRQGLRQLKGRDMITSFKDYIHEESKKKRRYRQVDPKMWSFNTDDGTAVTVRFGKWNDSAHFKRDGKRVNTTGRKDRSEILETFFEIMVSEMVPRLDKPGGGNDSIVFSFDKNTSMHKASIEILDKYTKKRLVSFSTVKSPSASWFYIGRYDEVLERKKRLGLIGGDGGY